MPYVRKPDEQLDQASVAAPQSILAGYGAPAAAPQAPSAPTGSQSAAPKVQSSTPRTQLLPGPADSGPSATGYVNFDRFFNANGAAAKRTAGNVVSSVGGAAQKAQGDLSNLQSQFAQQSKAGEGTAPSSADANWAANGTTPQQAPTTPTATGQPGKPVPQMQQQPQNHSQPGPKHHGKRPGNTPPQPGSQSLAPVTSGSPSIDAQVQAGAAGQYTGPSALNVMSGYGQAQADKANAQDQLSATQTQGGLQGLLQAQSQPGGYTGQMSAFDAALAGKAGQQQFANLRNKYSGLDKMFSDAQANSQTAANASRAQAAQNAGAYQSLEDQRDAAQKAAQASANPATADSGSQPWNPQGYSGLDNFMDPGNSAYGGWAHTVAMDASPVDDAGFLAGLAGYNGENPSQLFVGKFGANGNANGGSGDFFTGNMHNALGYVGDRYGHDALQKWWSSLTPEMWQQYQDMGNGGAMARSIIQWLRSSGYQNNSSLPDGM